MNLSTGQVTTVLQLSYGKFLPSLTVAPLSRVGFRQGWALGPCAIRAPKIRLKSSDGDRTAFRGWSDPRQGWSGPGSIQGFTVQFAIRICDLAFKSELQNEYKKFNKNIQNRGGSGEGGCGGTLPPLCANNTIHLLLALEASA